MVMEIGQCRRGRFIDQALALDAGKFCRLLRRNPHLVIEIRRNRDHGFFDLLSQKLFRVRDDLPKHDRGELLG